MKSILMAAAAALMLMVAVDPSYSQNAPWCGMQMGPGAPGTRDCRYNSFRQCTSEMLSGNRGNCMRNPAYGRGGYYKKKRHSYRSYRDGR